MARLGISVLFACAKHDVASSMGGSKANALLIEAMRAHPLVSEVALTKPDVPMTGCDVLVVEAPTGTPFVEACAPKYTVVLRHGDTPIGNCAYEQFDGDRIMMLVPSLWAARSLPRVAYMVQHMALEAVPNELPPVGSRVLHARAFDFMKDTLLAIDVAKCAPDLEFVFRMTEGHVATHPDLPPNISLLPAATGPAFWSDVGLVLLTSRAETFSMVAYEAACRGIPTVGHACLGGVREWMGPGWRDALDASTIAEACHRMVGGGELRPIIQDGARGVHQKALHQLDEWLLRAHREVYR